MRATALLSIPVRSATCPAPHPDCQGQAPLQGPLQGGRASSQAKSRHAKSSQAKPSQAKSRHAKSSQTKPSQAKSRQGKTSQAKPSQAKPSQAKPSQAKPSHPGCQWRPLQRGRALPCWYRGGGGSSTCERTISATTLHSWRCAATQQPPSLAESLTEVRSSSGELWGHGHCCNIGSARRRAGQQYQHEVDHLQLYAAFVI